jgi:hypothetical protein
MFAEWAGSVAVATFSSGGLAITHLHTCTCTTIMVNFITRVNIETMQPMDIPSLPKRVPSLISQLKKEGRL